MDACKSRGHKLVPYIRVRSKPRYSTPIGPEYSIGNGPQRDPNLENYPYDYVVYEKDTKRDPNLENYSYDLLRGPPFRHASESVGRSSEVTEPNPKLGFRV